MSGGVPAYKGVVLGDGASGYYRLGDTSTTAIDATANAWNGTYTGTLSEQTAGLISGDQQASTTFPGSGTARVNVPRNSRFEQTAISIEAWIKLTSINTYQVFATYGSDAGDTAPYDSYALQYRYGDTNNPFALQIAANNTYNLIEPSTGLGTLPLAGVIYHLVGTYDGTTAKLYVNGTLVASAAINAAINYRPTVSTGLTIGNSSALNSSANSAVQEVALFGSALTNTQVLNHYNAGVPAALYQNAYPANPTLVTPGPTVSNTFTVETWLKSATALTNYPALVSFGPDTAPLYETYILQAATLDGKNPADFYFNTSVGSYDLYGRTPLATGQAYHLAVTYDGASAALYVNGVFDGGLSAQGALLPFDGTHGLALFEKFNGGNPCSCQLWGTAIYGYPRSPAQIQADFQAAPGPTPPPTPTPAPTPTATPTPPGPIVDSSLQSTTGIEPYWQYATAGIHGGGLSSYNLVTRNLLVQASDMEVPNKGVNLAFHRTFNSRSEHDVTGTDGATPSNYGNGWTATFDAHMARNKAGGFSVFDVDGARYDYGPNGSGGWAPTTAGDHSTLSWDGQNGYFWTRTNGVAYYFWSPTIAANVPADAPYAGRLYKIFGRNSNNFVALAYSWDSANKVASISATTEAGRSATLTFADFAGHRLLSTLQWPDSTTVQYSYDASGNLTQVSHPSSRTGTNSLEQYGYQSVGSLPEGQHAVSWAAGPRWVASNGTDGSWLGFQFDTSLNLTQAQYTGIVNPALSDGVTSGVLQSGMPSGVQAYRTISYRYSVSGSQAITDISDTDGHSKRFVFDSTQRTTTITTNVGATALTTTATWSTDNNMVSLVDPSAIGRISRTTRMAISPPSACRQRRRPPEHSAQRSSFRTTATATSLRRAAPRGFTRIPLIGIQPADPALIQRLAPPKLGSLKFSTLTQAMSSTES